MPKPELSPRTLAPSLVRPPPAPLAPPAAAPAPAPRWEAMKQNERRCIQSCFRQLREAEAALVKARETLSELNVPEVAEEAKQSSGSTQSTCIASLEEQPTPPPLTSPLKNRDRFISRDSNESRADRAPGGGSRHGSHESSSPPLLQPGYDDGPHSPSKGSSMSWWSADVSPVDLSLNPCVMDQVVVSSIASFTGSSPAAKAAGVGRHSTLYSGHRTKRGESFHPSPLQARWFGSVPCCVRYLRWLHHELSWEPIFGCIFVPMFHPESKLVIIWTAVGFVFIVYEAFAVPACLAFDIEATGALFVYASMVNSYFLADIALKFFFGKMDQHGAIMVKPSEVALSYLQGWFLADIVSGIPWEWIPTEASGAQMLRIIRSLRLLRLMRLLRIAKLGPMMDKVQTKLESNHIYMFAIGVLRVGGLLIAVCHWSACLWYAVGVNSSHRNQEYGPGQPATWVQVYQLDYPFIGTEKFHHYIFACYFTLTTMTTVGYGDIRPTNVDEAVFVMALLLMSSVLFASLMGKMTDMIATLNSQQHLLAEKKVVLSRYMHWRAVPWKLMRSIRQHLLFLWDANAGYDAYEEQLKDQLPPVLKAELCHHIYGRILENAPFLGWMRDYPICTKHLAETVKSSFFERGDYVFHIGQQNDQIYILLTGTVVVSRNEYLFNEYLYDHDKDHRAHNAPPPRADIIEDALLAFDIPRNKEGKALLGSAKDMMGGFQTPVRVNRERSAYGVRKIGRETFDSEVMQMAIVELRRNDLRRRAAARTVQKHWRLRLATRGAAFMRPQGPGSPTRRGKSGGFRINCMQSRRLSAPAYFGESCLWQPLEEWDRTPPPVYLYSVRCECRGEVIWIPRSAVLALLERFSPWLVERFHLFRQVVFERFRDMMQEDEIFRHMALDWAGADIMEPMDEKEPLDASMRQALSRGHQRRPPTNRPPSNTGRTREAGAPGAWPDGQPSRSRRSHSPEALNGHGRSPTITGAGSLPPRRRSFVAEAPPAEDVAGSFVFEATRRA